MSNPKITVTALLIAVIVAASAMLALGGCKSPPPPSATPGNATLTTDDVPRMTIEELLQKIESGSDILIVDTQEKEEYDRAHIEGAVSVPYSVIAEGKWIPSRDTEIILYCN